MASIVLIGAGSATLGVKLCSDILLTPALQDSTLTLVDIDATRLERTCKFAKTLVARYRLGARVRATVDCHQAIQGADYVITTFRQGGHLACASDATILARYGISQCIGDNLGPGAICRGLRSIPVLLDLCHDLEKWAPRAVILNYVAPIAANGMALSRETGLYPLGLDCSVQNTARLLARLARVSISDLDYLCAGISHQAWFLKLRRGTTDLYPRIHEALEQDGVIQAEPLRSAMFKSLGYYVTESSEITGAQEGHLANSIHGGHSDLGPLHRSLEDRRARPSGLHSLSNPLPANREVDHVSSGFKAMTARHLPGGAADVIQSMETGNRARVDGNVPNRHLIENLPPGCCVQVPCEVNAHGIRGVPVGSLPEPLAVINRRNIRVQKLVVDAALTGDMDAFHQAFMADPLVAALCSQAQIHALADELLAAQAPWLPPFVTLKMMATSWPTPATH